MSSESWEKVRLGEVVTLRQGFAVNKKSNHYISESGYPLLKISDLFAGTETLFVNKDIPKQFLVNKDEIIYSRTGQVGYAFMGKTGVVYNNCFKVIPNERVNSKFLYQLLNTNEVRNMAQSLATGTAQPDLNHDAFKSIKIALPPLEIQKKIAKKLSNYDDLIENNQKQIELLEKKARLTYEEWFLRFRIDGKKLDIDEDSGLPFGWEKIKLGEVVNFKYGTMPKKDLVSDSGYPIYSGYKTTGFYKELMFEKPTLIVVARGVGGTGDVKISPRNCWLTNLSIAILVSEQTTQNYLFYHLQTLNLRSLDSGSAQSQITITSLEKLVIINPTKEVLNRFDNYVIPIINEVENLKKQNQKLKEARNILLPRLMSGMIEL